MSEAVQVLKLNPANSGYVLNCGDLEKILLADDVKDTLVTVVSVAGAFRKGKSFLLSFMLRYLESTYETKNTSNWLGDENTELGGFAWRGGSERHTTGMLIWPQLYQHTLANGAKVSIILEDTQGTFDNKSSIQDCVTIFALSTLISSVQIFNIFHNIQEDDLQQLQLFTEYGKLAMTNDNEKPFQKLQFLIRDFNFPCDFPFGAEGGRGLLRKVLEITNDQPNELKEIRKQIMKYYRDTDCFLMPFPGKLVQKADFSGQLKDIDDDFKQCLLEFVPLILGPENLVTKQINGVSITAKDLYYYMKEYSDIFQSDKVPSALSIFEATVKANNMSAVEYSKTSYNSQMSAICNGHSSHIDPNQLLGHHEGYKASALEMFNNRAKIGSEDQKQFHREKLITELEILHNQFKALNEHKKAEELRIQMEALQIQAQQAQLEAAQRQAQIDLANQQLIEQQQQQAAAAAALQAQIAAANNAPTVVIHRRRRRFRLF